MRERYVYALRLDVREPAMSRRFETELDAKLSSYVQELARMRTRGSGRTMTPSDVIRELIEESYESFLLHEMIRKVRS